MTKQTFPKQWTAISAHPDFTILNRGDLFEKRRSLMEAWGKFVTDAKDNVITLARDVS